MPESYIESRLREAVKRLDGLAIKLTSFSFTGLPDRLILLPGGKVFFVETKHSEKKPRPRQLIVHEQLRSLGFMVFVIRTNEDLKGFLAIVELI